ncbi:MAG: GNAT family N-acetyltransferase [Clostridia bacterium]|nr:GNAT family N-acetyltransferase [Clostridia bacterium]
MEIRKGTEADVPLIAHIESVCFPPAEAASYQSFVRRMALYPEGFWLLVEEGETVAFVNGMESDAYDLSDDMYENNTLYKKDGEWEVILSVATLPEKRGKGYARALLKQAIADTAARGKKGLVLTCKKALIGFYESVGFVSEGLSESKHGGAEWYQMRVECGKNGADR